MSQSDLPNYEQPPQTSQNSDFQSQFSVLKNWSNLSKKNFYEEYSLKMCPIFVGSVHSFGKSDNDIIS